MELYKTHKFSYLLNSFVVPIILKRGKIRIKDSENCFSTITTISTIILLYVQERVWGGLLPTVLQLLGCRIQGPTFQQRTLNNPECQTHKATNKLGIIILLLLLITQFLSHSSSFNRDQNNSRVWLVSLPMEQSVNFQKFSEVSHGINLEIMPVHCFEDMLCFNGICSKQPFEDA